jgi:hypothetical protein
MRRANTDLLIVPMAPSFAEKSRAAQADWINEIQAQADKAGLEGAVVPVWESAPGRMAFVAPAPLHPLLKDLTVKRVLTMLNRDLSW